METFMFFVAFLLGGFFGYITQDFLDEIKGLKSSKLVYEIHIQDCVNRNLHNFVKKILGEDEYKAIIKRMREHFSELSENIGIHDKEKS